LIDIFSLISMMKVKKKKKKKNPMANTRKAS